MIYNSNTRQLYNRLEVAKRLLSNSKNLDERVCLSNYIGNVYSAIDAVSNNGVSTNKKQMFGSHKNYKKFLKKIDIYELKMLENFVLHKDFHSTYMYDILSGVEFNFSELEDEKLVNTTLLSSGEFYGIFYDFMKSINLENIFNDFIKQGRIYRAVNSDDDYLLGFTLFNPINHDSDVFVKDFNYNIHTMYTLAHEFGHVYDLSKFDESVVKYNRFFYQSFYGEVISKLFERLFLQYLIDHNILLEEAQDKLFEMQIINHDFLLSSYILSLLDDESIVSNAYCYMSKDELFNKVKANFVTEDAVYDYIINSTDLDIHQSYLYTYGDIISMFLKNIVKNEGLSASIVNDFLSIRSDLFSDEVLKKWEMSAENYNDLHKKEMQMIKK